MGSAVCTLFEGHYHHGVAALTNSLYQNGFRGDVFAGYRGQLPAWAAEAAVNNNIAWPGCTSYNAAEGLAVHFLPVDTHFHLAHYKPDFMHTLLTDVAKNADGIAYFDPDIVIKCKWEFYENWMANGVALVHEIVSNDMPPTHPSRKKWEQVIKMYNRQVTHHLYSYLNCGFCGVNRAYTEFLKVWSDVIQIAVKHYNQNPAQFASFDRTSTFWSIDQDAFNIAAMCCNSPLSEIGSEGMDFIASGWTMSHATGSPKPWKKNFLLGALDGKPPTTPEKSYWQYADTPILTSSKAFIKFKRVCILITAFTGRFYRRYY